MDLDRFGVHLLGRHTSSWDPRCILDTERYPIAQGIWLLGERLRLDSMKVLASSTQCSSYHILFNCQQFYMSHIHSIAKLQKLYS